MKVVVGVDAGGTYTRALCTGLDCEPLGRGESGGGSPAHNADARANIREAIHAALADASASEADVAALVAGIAGFDSPSDAEWANEFIALPGLTGARIALNDTEVAHAGAFGGEPGIIVIAGTGSNIFGITETGKKLTNDQFMHYAGGARHVAFDAVQRLLVDSATEDPILMTAALAHWHARDVGELRAAVMTEIAGDHDEMKRRFGAFAPTVTALAPTSALAHTAVDRLAESTRIGVDLLAGCFATTTAAVPVVLEGGLARSDAFTAALTDALRSGGSRCAIVQPQSSPAAGAVVLAVKAARVDS